MTPIIFFHKKISPNLVEWQAKETIAHTQTETNCLGWI